MIDLPSLLGALGLTPAQVILVLVASMLIAGLTNLAKSLIPEHLRQIVPLVSLVVGVLVMLLVSLVAVPPIPTLTAVLIGLCLALMASGVWSWSKQLNAERTNVR